MTQINKAEFKRAYGAVHCISSTEPFVGRIMHFTANKAQPSRDCGLCGSTQGRTNGRPDSLPFAVEIVAILDLFLSISNQVKTAVHALNSENLQQSLVISNKKITDHRERFIPMMGQPEAFECVGVMQRRG